MPNVIYKKYSVLGQPRYWNRRERMWTKCLSKNIWNLTEKDLLTKKEALAEYGVKTLC